MAAKSQQLLALPRMQQVSKAKMALTNPYIGSAV
jgi:hypothetical protein